MDVGRKAASPWTLNAPGVFVQGLRVCDASGEARAGMRRSTKPRKSFRLQYGCGSKPMASHLGVGEFTTHFRTYFSGDWDVHWGYEILTHGHMFSPGSFRGNLSLDMSSICLRIYVSPLLSKGIWTYAFFFSRTQEN